MREKEVDARGLDCPRPVVMTRKAILAGDADMLRILVSQEVQGENVLRMANSQGWTASVKKEGDFFFVLAEKGPEAEGAAASPAEGKPATAAKNEPSTAAAASPPRVAVFLTSDLFGRGDAELGRILMKAFIKTIGDLDPLPGKLIFVNSAVGLTTEGSAVISDLKALTARGIEIISCGTCLDFYGLLDKLEVGLASNMYEIAQSLVEADRVIRP